MSAKSRANLLQLPHPGKLARWGRNAVSMAVLAASLAALFLILVQQHGHLIHGAYARIVPAETFKSANQPDTVLAFPVVTAEEHRQRAIAEFLAKRYRISFEGASNFVGIAHSAGRQFGLDPHLILAVMAVESRFNPIAESWVGAKGLMQIIPKYHADKLDGFGGAKAVFDPEINILVGSQILKDYLRRTGNLGMALQMYAGALGDNQDVYTERVMGEKQRLHRVATQSTMRGGAKTIAMGDGTQDGRPRGR
jgi:soluble lytic murein transglycosylase-like protein